MVLTGLIHGRPRAKWPAAAQLLALLALLVMAFASAPASAHKGHQNTVAAKPEATVAAQGVEVEQVKAAPGSPVTMPADRPQNLIDRLLDWLGRTHPMFVHFPIAFLPAAFITALVARRRSAFDVPVRFLAVAGGLLAPIAALAGWLDAGLALASDDWLTAVHRWLGSAIGFAGLAVALWLWRRPDAVRRTALVTSLGLITLATLVQGWFGGALVHGADHLNF